jgi:starch phosphorylase
MILGLGGAKLLDELGYEPEVYHLNEAHAVSAAFHLYQKFESADEVRKRMVFTTHTPEEAGNDKNDINQLNIMSFFGKVPLETVREITGIEDNVFNHSLAALRLSRKANGVSKLHGEVSRHMWGSYGGIPEITHVTNAQNLRYWVDAELEKIPQKRRPDGDHRT